MPPTDSEGPGPKPVEASEQAAVPTYRFSFSWESPYGRAVRLVEAHAPEGLVLDLGCGYGAVGEVFIERGRRYVGADLDDLAVADLTARHLEAHIIDLSAHDGLADRLADLVAGRPLGAILLLDALEHLVEPMAVLDELARLCATLEHPPVLVTSIPNVAHIDLAAKLVAGRWDITPSGLLDRTHVQMFTANRIAHEFAAHGWHECGRDDLPLDPSDQYFPPFHPLLIRHSPAHQYLRTFRDAADPFAGINQFVRAYTRDPIAEREVGTPERDVGPRSPFLTVLTRTQGTRPALLAEALTCLAAQSNDDLEVIVLVHTDDQDAVTSVQALVAQFADDFSSRVRVTQVRGGGGRSAPLNTGLALARGDYIGFLDDDDQVTAEWAECFASCAARGPGQVVRSICYSRYVRQPSSKEAHGTRAHSVTLTNLTAEFSDTFDMVRHLRFNTSPIMSFAVPRALVAELGMDFNEEMSVCEDWEFLVRCALVVGVVDSAVITSIYQRWRGDGTTTSSGPGEQWDHAMAQMIARLNSGPLLLPAGSASVVADLMAEHVAASTRDAVAASDTPLDQRVLDLQDQRDEALRQLHEVVNSEFWRATGPLRKGVTWAKRRAKARRQQS